MGHLKSLMVKLKIPEIWRLQCIHNMSPSLFQVIILYLSTRCPQTFPDLATPICPTMTSIPSPELLHPSPFLHLIPWSATLYISRPRSVVPLSIWPGCYVPVLFFGLLLSQPRRDLNLDLSSCLPAFWLPVRTSKLLHNLVFSWLEHNLWKGQK